jgi:hypothetical protein
VAKDGSRLPYGKAHDIAARTIAFQEYLGDRFAPRFGSDLNGLAYQKAETEIEIRRYQDLDPTNNRLTASDFVFTTPPVTFATPAVPLIIRPSFDLS